MNENPQEDLSGPVRVMQIIVLAFAMGLLFFLAIVCVVRRGGMRGAFDAMPLFTLIGLGLAVMMLVARAIVLQVLTTNARRGILRGASAVGREKSSSDLPDRAAAQLVAVYQTRMIVGLALLEGPGFLLLIVHMIERSPWSLAAAILIIFGIIAHFPTRERVAEWIEQQLSLLQEERQLD